MQNKYRKRRLFTSEVIISEKKLTQLDKERDCNNAVM